MRLAQGVIGIAGYGLAGLAVTSLALGAWLARNTLTLASDSQRTIGVVLGHRESPQPDGRPVFTPRIGFTTPNGTRHEFLGQVTAPVKRFVERAAVPVVYREAEPDQARIDTFVDNWLGASVALGLALLSALAALMLVRSAQRELRR